MSERPTWMENHIRLYRTDPEKAHFWDPVNSRQGEIASLLLTTKGRKSGAPRPTPLYYGKTETGFAIVASNGGSPTHPAWYLNLAADPIVEIQVGPRHYKARARTAAGAERQTIWAEMTRIFSRYDEYQAKAGREVPVVVLEPVS